jgi:hypothetical protein
MNSDTFYLSFENGVCRMSHGTCLKTAGEDALNAANATGLSVTVLNFKLKPVGYVGRTPSPGGPLLASVFAFAAFNLGDTTEVPEGLT